MKILTDFVTNSSSSSFVAWGVSIDDVAFTPEKLLSIFNSKMKYFESKKADEGYNRWYKEDHEEMLALQTDEERAEYVRDNFDFEDKLSAYESSSILEFNESYVNAIGISPSTLIDKFPTKQIGEIKAIVAEELNKAFGTKFEKEDISYFEEGWFDG